MNFDNLLQTCIGLVLISVVLIDAGLTIAWLLRNRCPVWQSMVYRTTLAGLLIALVLVIGLSGRFANRYSIVQPDIMPEITSFTVSSSPSSLPQISASTPYIPGDTEKTHETGTHNILLKFLTLNTVLVIWGIGIVIGLIGLCTGSIMLMLLNRDSDDVDDDAVFTLVDQLSERLYVTAPRVKISRTIDSPFLTGIWKPVIYLPEDYSDQYDLPTLRAIIAHELTHLANRDCLFLYLSRLCLLLFWINPLIWLLHKRLDLVSEEICDATVVTLDCPPAEYANSLLSLAERLRPTAYAFAIGAVPVKSTLGKRIQAILALSSNRLAGLSGKAKGSAAFISSCIVLFAVVALCPSGMTPIGEYPAHYADNFTLAKEMGWSIGQVYRDKSLIKFGGTSSVINNNYLKLMYEEVMPKCNYNDKRLHKYYCIGYDHPPYYVNKKVLLEKSYKESPNFYNAYCLSLYKADQGDFTSSHELLIKSLKQAPEMLAGRILLYNGKPAVHYRQRLNFDYKRDEADDFQNVSFEIDLRTDENGCYYAPCLKGIYKLNGYVCVPTQTGFESVSPFIDWQDSYLSNQRIGLLPPIYLRSYIQVDRKWSIDRGKATPVTSDSINISWKHDPNIDYYRYGMDGVLEYLEGNKIYSDNVEIPTKRYYNDGKIHNVFIRGFKGNREYCGSRFIFFEYNSNYPSATLSEIR